MVLFNHKVGIEDVCLGHIWATTTPGRDNEETTTIY